MSRASWLRIRKILMEIFQQYLYAVPCCHHLLRTCHARCVRSIHSPSELSTAPSAWCVASRLSAPVVTRSSMQQCNHLGCFSDVEMYVPMYINFEHDFLKNMFSLTPTASCVTYLCYCLTELLETFYSVS